MNIIMSLKTVFTVNGILILLHGTRRAIWKLKTLI